MRNLFTTTAAFCLLAAGAALGHGDVAPQPMETGTLPDIGEEWLTENPYRALGDEVWAEAVRIGASGYNQNCARCHGLEGVSGGLAPDLRYLEAEEYGDEWFVERFQTGYTQNGITKMPAFGELLGQKAAWAIRTYVETRPDDDSMQDASALLAEIRDALGELSKRADAGTASAGEIADGVAGAEARLAEIAGEIETASGAPFADSAAWRAAVALRDEGGLKVAWEALTVGLSNAQ